MPVRYDGFSTPEIIYMNKAFKLMQRASGDARRSLLGGDLTAYHKWFDSTDTRAQLMKVATIVNQVDQAINGRPITFAKADRPGVNVDTKDLCGYVYLLRQRGQRFHVGSGMRIILVWATHARHDLDYLAQTMYHELTHKVGSTRDRSYKERKCLRYAETAPHMAANNAENYNLFLREFV